MSQYSEHLQNNQTTILLISRSDCDAQRLEQRRPRLAPTRYLLEWQHRFNSKMHWIEQHRVKLEHKRPRPDWPRSEPLLNLNSRSKLKVYHCVYVHISRVVSSLLIANIRSRSLARSLSLSLSQ